MLDQVLQQLANAVSRLTGENMALRAMINAIIATHPDREALARAFEIAQRSAVEDWMRVPPDNETRFRAEQVMDQLAKEIDDHEKHGSEN